MASLFIWWIVIVFLGLMALPLSFLTFKHLPDKGYAFSKPLGILFVGYFAWLMGHVGYNQAVPYFAVVLLIVASAFLLSRTWNSIVDFFKTRAGYILVAEIFFLTAMIVAGAYKMRTPDIVGTEKPMDMAMINGISSSLSMPPNDPWLSGGSVSYYYFGYFMVSMISKLTGIDAPVAYNLGVVMSWALAALAAFGLGYALTRRYRYAGFSAAAVTVLGNMDFWHRVGQSAKFGDLRIPYYNFPVDPKAATGLDGAMAFLFSPLKHYWDYFQASRIIPVEKTDKMINEFPAFSYFLSDLHPHVMAIPFVLLAVALALNILKAPLAGLDVFGGRRPWQIAQWVLVAAVFGSMGFLNSWDFPTMLLLLGMSLALQQMWALGEASKDWFKKLALVGLPIVGGAFLLYLPFYLKFQSQAKGVGFVKDRTDLYYLFVLFGLFLIVVMPVLVGRAISSRGEKGRRSKKSSEGLECVICGREGSGKKFCGFCGGELEPSANAEVTPLPAEGLRSGLQKSSLWLSGDNAWHGWVVLGVVAAILVALTIGKLDLSVLLVSLLFVYLGLVSLTVKSENKEMVFATLLSIVAFLLIAGCEVLYVKDHFDNGALYRMNSMFKFHYQAWLLFAIACAPLLKWLFEAQWPSWNLLKRISWGTLAGLALIAALLYPMMSLKSRLAGSSSAVRTLDGANYFKTGDQANSEAVEWIRKNVAPKGRKVPVILEAWGGSYSQYARLATYTGYPTILGWDFHEAQWRGSWDKAAIRGGKEDDTVLKRREDVDTIYSTTDSARAMELLKKYGVEYVFVGNLEREKYSSQMAGLEKFPQMGAPVFNYAGATLYRVAP